MMSSSEDANVVNPHFDKQKQHALSKCDLSRKGSIDAPISDLITHINGHPDLCTSSSCSGRVMIVLASHTVTTLKQVHNESELESPNTDTDGNLHAAETHGDQEDIANSKRTRVKQHIEWLYSSHSAPDNLSDDLWSRMLNHSRGGQNQDSVITLKFEPFIVHLQCRDLITARRMHALAVQSGCRNSGIVVSGSRKITVAVRCTLGMEVPLLLEESMDLPTMHRYVHWLMTSVAKQKFIDNQILIDRFICEYNKQFGS